uniref:Uncharacterized protein n=1 Tax=Cacopsylla melanoneura TaxID=428564 RepID=A0A8D8T0N3_9HEMI
MEIKRIFLDKWKTEKDSLFLLLLLCFSLLSLLLSSPSLPSPLTLSSLSLFFSPSPLFILLSSFSSVSLFLLSCSSHPAPLLLSFLLPSSLILLFFPSLPFPSFSPTPLFPSPQRHNVSA